MVRKLLMAGVAGVLCMGLWVGCQKDNPASPTPDPAFAGTWTGLTTKTGGILPDSFTVVLTCTKTNYTMIRMMLTHASSGDPILDSAWETGTIAANGSNYTLNATQCKERAAWQSVLEDATCRDQQRTFSAIANNEWPVVINEWKSGDPISYTLKK